ncbi:MAG: RNA polymerase sigma factor [Chromatiales bacterium]|jgi:RNA polymerase sigma-70 factor (ECF subfamily)|nr:RNA polymerase sigma factor [Chromatiales bacterium]
MPVEDAISKKQNPAAVFEALMRPHLKPLFRIAYRLTGRREDAEDLVQDLLTKLYARRQELDGIDNLRSWLIRVMYRQFIDHRRQHARSPLRLVVEASSDEEDADPLSRIASEDDPQAHAEASAREAALLKAIERLSEDHQRVLALHDMEGYTLEEIQEVLDCPIGTLKSRLHRARARLRELLTAAENPENQTVEPSANSARHTIHTRLNSEHSHELPGSPEPAG